MTDDVGDRLSLQLHERVPEPPRLCTAQEVWARPAPQPRCGLTSTRGAAMTAAAAIVGIIAAAAATLSLHDSAPDGHAGSPTSVMSSPTPPRVITRPDALVGPTWTLQTFRPERGTTVHAHAASAPTVNFSADGTVKDNLCSLATSTLGAGRIVVHQGFVNDLTTTLCGPRSSIALDNAVEDALTPGTVTWSVISDTLTLRRRGVGTLTFAADRADATIAGRMFVVGGPAPGTPRPVSGSVTLHEAAGSVPVRARVDSRGRFSVAVTPGRWVITGSASNLKSVSCRSSAFVEAAGHQVSRALVYCQIR